MTILAVPLVPIAAALAGVVILGGLLLVVALVIVGLSWTGRR
jgi:hypothetical protein